VFLSSPGDVAEERAVARDVMRELGASHLLRGQVHFDVEAWDRRPARHRLAGA
jgi:hypothetical protein